MNKQTLIAIFLITFNTIPVLQAESPNDLNDFLDTNITTATQNSSSCATPEEIIELLLRINAPTILQRNIYNLTNPINVRDVIYSPILGQKEPLSNCLSISLDLFYSTIPRAFFTKKSDSIAKYINLDQPELINQLEDINRQFRLLDIPEVLSVLRNTKLEERKGGLMIGVHWDNAPWYLSVKAPIYYIEHNFRPNDEQIRRLQEQAPADPAFQESAEDFAHQHLVSDRVGLGDTLLQAAYTVIDSPRETLLLGLEATLPTAATFRAGLIGGTFKKQCCRPDFSLERLFDLFLCKPERQDLAKVQSLGADFLIGALDQLTANLADTPLGNGGHVGIGPLINYQLRCTRCIDFNLYSAFEYLTPATHARYFIQEKDPAAFNRNFDDPNRAQENLNFLNEQLINTLYPFIIPVKVRPGTILTIRPSVTITCKRFTFNGGYDFWRQGREKLLEFKAPNILVRTLKINNGIKPAAAQHKLFGALWVPVYCTDTYDLLFSIKADVTLASSGIGKEFTGALGIEFNF